MKVLAVQCVANSDVRELVYQLLGELSERMSYRWLGQLNDVRNSLSEDEYEAPEYVSAALDAVSTVEALLVDENVPPAELIALVEGLP